MTSDDDLELLLYVHWMNHHSDPRSKNNSYFYTATPGLDKTSLNFSIYAVNLRMNISGKREHEISNTWQGRDEAGSYEAAGGRSCSRAP